MNSYNNSDYLNSLFESKNEINPFYVENWYETLKTLTPETIFLDLEQKEAQAIVNFYRFRYHQVNSFTKEDQEILELLEKRINDNISKYSLNSGVFVKFSFRSPKDGFPLANDKIEVCFHEELSKLNNKWSYESCKDVISPEDYLGNLNWISFVRSLERLMNCHNGKEALNIILSSERAYQDLLYALEYENCNEEMFKEKEAWSMKLILRRWVDGVNGLYEFRGFVKNNQMTAITQYNHPFFIPDLQSDQACTEIKSSLFSFWKKNVYERLKALGTYVIDFAIKDDNEILLIELNPFRDSCGSGMFSWSADRKLLNGEEIDPNISEIENICIRVRKDNEIPYASHWESFLVYMMADMSAARPYYEFFTK